MDGQTREREMATEIRCIVKATAGENRRVAMLRRQQKPPSVLQSPPERTCTSTARPSTHTESADAIGMLPAPAQAIKLKGRALHNAGIDSTIPNPDSSLLGSPIVSDDDQTSLLMHYLDHVFPLQFPFYQPSIWNGGRGWLLSTLMQTKPLCYAALSFAAYHRQSFFCKGTTNAKPRCFQVEALQEKHVRAIRGLRHYLERIGTGIRNQDLVDSVKVLCCMALLISLEVSRFPSTMCWKLKFSNKVYVDSTDSWRMHLHAASALIADLKSEEMMQARKHLSPSYEAALFFFAGVIAWYDVLSCATTGSRPFFQCNGLGAGECCIHLDKIMGSENWAMLCIMDIATLDEWKNGLQASGKLSMHKLVSRATDIEHRLEGGLTRSFEKLDAAHSLPPSSYSTETKPLDLVSIITRTFACSALVYLHVVVSGPCPGMPAIRESVTRTIAALRAFPDQNIAATLSWPLCVAGCMALEEDEDFFRTLNTTERMFDPTFGNSLKVLTIMEECWRLRKQEQGRDTVDWRSAMNSLGIDILLV